MIPLTFIAAISNEITVITFLQFGVINFSDAARSTRSVHLINFAHDYFTAAAVNCIAVGKVIRHCALKEVWYTLRDVVEKKKNDEIEIS